MIISVGCPPTVKDSAEALIVMSRVSISMASLKYLQDLPLYATTKPYEIKVKSICIMNPCAIISFWKPTIRLLSVMSVIGLACSLLRHMGFRLSAT